MNGSRLHLNLANSGCLYHGDSGGMGCTLFIMIAYAFGIFEFILRNYMHVHA